ncbi:MAG: UDP-glucose/GDP-mannose dehydrogenase family protein [Bacillati bacterium ANGP1]|uniref:UDP-glucose/GDP-mannose dehydrogenase family protein n=1 Tax=Candidatus Segetimicrobium genomatis TaxID=2569760 RepID=A0A537JCY6_9BACT|nr:MAG: UDP-glucose/GDP-mannose dehydrogenase family protein [Terrabacteria group bacterium ANGP1]
MNVTMIGAGRVGLVAAACLAELGIKVHCVDKIAERIDGLRVGTMPFQEPGLAELVRKNVHAGRLCFSTNLDEAVDRSLVLFVAVGTEDEVPGKPNLKGLFEVGRQIARVMKEYRVLTIKSTVPPGTARLLRLQPRVLARGIGHRGFHAPGPRRPWGTQPACAGDHEGHLPASLSRGYAHRDDG